METMTDLVLLLRGCSSSHYELLPQDTLVAFIRDHRGVQLLCWDKGNLNGAVSVDCSLDSILEESRTEALHVYTSLDLLPTATTSLPAFAHLECWKDPPTAGGSSKGSSARPLVAITAKSSCLINWDVANSVQGIRIKYERQKKKQPEGRKDCGRGLG
mmetsp:Transcript_2666/g.4320  ORF Transcript_2666/g.4320 Transcript_2666/m.4320 type:complete len:158 (-) Transcript_2666:163-636(-)